MDNSEQNMMSPKKNSTWGPAIGLIIILLLIVAGSLYFFKTTPETENGSSLEEQANELEEANNLEGSVNLESDLNNPEMENLDAELQKMETEI